VRLPLGLVLGATLVFAAAPQGAAAATSITAAPSPAAATTDALAAVNAYRAMAGLGPVASQDEWVGGATNHSCYMIQNGIAHSETVGAPGYTVDGAAAGLHSNVAVSGSAATSAGDFVDLWMTGPFHAIGILRPSLQAVAYGSCTVDTGPLPWRAAGTLNVLSGLGPKVPLAAPVVWPGDGTTTRLDHFVAEAPNPVNLCGWSGSASLPVLAMMPEPATGVRATITGPSGPLPTCALAADNVGDATAKSILGGDNAVTVLARDAFAPGTYTVTITTQARTVTWSFTVDPNPSAPVLAAPAPMPITNTSIIGATGGVTVVPPFRLLDTRENTGTARLARNTVTRIQVAGNGSVPLGATGVNANFTTVGSSKNGYLRVDACGAQAPSVSTVNFAAGSIVANAALVPLDAQGALCLYANTDLDVVIDVNGYVSPTSTGHYHATPPQRLFDTRSAFRVPGRLPAEGTMEVQMTGADTGIPTDARAVLFNLTAVGADAKTFVTAYPCGGERPLVSNLNPDAGDVRPNTVLVPLSPSGTVCFYSPVAVDLLADLAGYVAADAGMRFTPLAPTRLVDTRDPQPEVDLGGGGSPLAAGSTHQIDISGLRGVPASAAAVSINVTATEPAGAGYVTLWPCSSTRPTTSALNVGAGTTVANGSQASLSLDGALCVYTQSSTHLIVDINGYWS
jgi:hypothetical protein